jgi:hypothetical protein
MTSWEFESFRIGRLFHFNGNDYVKQSTRTARMLSNGRFFYFGKKEIIHAIAY